MLGPEKFYWVQRTLQKKRGELPHAIVDSIWLIDSRGRREDQRDSITRLMQRIEIMVGYQ